MPARQPPKLETLRALLDYDAETGLFTWRRDRGGMAFAGTVAGAVNNKGYREIMVDRVRHKAHRLAWLYVTGQWPADQIDHINGQRDDNRFANLREADNTLNCRNQSRPRSNTSGHKGVSWHKKMGKWTAHIRSEYRCIWLGAFDRIEDAIAARREAETRMFGDFRRADECVRQQ